MQMEWLSVSYISAVAAFADWVAEIAKVDRGSVDGTLKSEEGICPRIDFQLKSTAKDILRSDGLHYSLGHKNYNDLCKDPTAAPRILIVMLMPKKESHRLSQSSEELCMRYCSYWTSIKGKSPIPKNSSKTVILSEIFDVDQLKIFPDIFF